MKYWEGFQIVEIPISEVLPQANPECLIQLKDKGPKKGWYRHLLSLEKYKSEVLDNGWINPISISILNDKDLLECPSKDAYREDIKYIIGVGWNRHYWSAEWGLKTIGSIVFDNWLESQSVRSLMEAVKKSTQLGIQRVEGNLLIPEDKMIHYDLYNTRIPQRLLPRFQIEPSRIVERVRGERSRLTGSIRVVRPFAGWRGQTSKFFQISGEPPTEDEPFVASLMPEGWISMPRDFPKYLKLFREWG